jgi:hypothetical protein
MHISNAPIQSCTVSAAGITTSNVAAYIQDECASIPGGCMKIPVRHYCAETGCDVCQLPNQRLPGSVCSG